MENQVLPMPSKPHSPVTSDSNRTNLISDALTRFALNAGIALDDKGRGVYLSMWQDAFADIESGRLQAAFVACLQSHTFKTMPTIGDVRQHLSNAEKGAANLEAEKKWEQVKAYALRCSPDYAERNPPRICEQTMAAIRAAGGLDYIRDCDQESLQWAKKRFLESLQQWAALDKNKFLLPDGEIKNLLADAPQMKALP